MDENITLGEWFCALSTLEMPFYAEVERTALSAKLRDSSRYHPDKCSDCGDKMQEINSAYNLIKVNMEQGNIDGQQYMQTLFQETLSKYFSYADLVVSGNEEMLMQLLGSDMPDFCNQD